MTVNLKDIGCDAYATSLQKGMLAPLGLGLLFLSDNIQNIVRIPELELGPQYCTDATGMRDAAAMLGAAAARDFLARQGMDQVYEIIQALKSQLRTGILSIGGIKTVTPLQDLASSILVIELPPNISSVDLSQRLFEAHHIRVKNLPGNRIRFCLHIHLKAEDIEITLKVLREELSGAQT